MNGQWAAPWPSHAWPSCVHSHRLPVLVLSSCAVFTVVFYATTCAHPISLALCCTPTILLSPQPFYCHPNHSTATPTILLPPQPFYCHPNHSAVPQPFCCTPTILLSPQPFCCHLHTRIPQRTEKRYYPTHLAVNLLSGGCDWAVIQLTNQIASCICMCYTTEHKQTVHRK